MVSDCHKLTIEEKNKFWTDEIFFSGDAIDLLELEHGLHWLYSTAGKRMPEIFICDSPGMWYNSLETLKEKGCLYHNRIEINAGIEIGRYLHSLLSCLLPESKIELVKKIMDWQILGYLRDRLINYSSHQPTVNLMPYYWFSAEGLLFSCEKLALYDSFGLLQNKGDERLSRYMAFLKSGVLLSSFFSRVAVIFRRPTRIMLNSQGWLHCNGGGAIEWHDGFRQYYLNGVRVPEEVALPRSVDLDPAMVLKETNAGVRREIVRKIGIERVVQKLGGEIIDSWKGYELIKLNIPGMRQRPTYLKMRNPSIGIYHMEGVSPRIKTCRGALKWRVGGTNWNPEQLT